MGYPTVRQVEAFGKIQAATEALEKLIEHRAKDGEVLNEVLEDGDATPMLTRFYIALEDIEGKGLRA